MLQRALLHRHRVDEGAVAAIQVLNMERSGVVGLYHTMAARYFQIRDRKLVGRDATDNKLLRRQGKHGSLARPGHTNQSRLGREAHEEIAQSVSLFGLSEQIVTIRSDSELSPNLLTSL